ncbi:hypothetical protein DA01_08715 [Dehalococcoides mccartyi]|uniref:Uncharacterized protein n=1 Tax=Dehalococcoides mccartyi TaxID=61435 RepID=A0A0V8LXB9_9CHLR|nr:hypothetical protein [Dehalococcoides mccartyi]KSV16162.1 hypothetical protein DA01_08715 [Dehalococcoides mccartyi]
MDIVLALVIGAIGVGFLLALAYLFGSLQGHIDNLRRRYYYIGYHNIVDNSKMIISGPYETSEESLEFIIGKPYVAYAFQYKLKTLDVTKAADQISNGAKYAQLYELTRPPNINN